MHSAHTRGIQGLTHAVSVEDVAYSLLILGTLALITIFIVGLWLIISGSFDLTSLGTAL